MAKTTPKAKPYGNPDKGNVRRNSNPKTPGEQKQAIADDLEAEIRGYIPVLIMEGAFMRRSIRQVEGLGGPELKLYEKEFESGFANSSPKDKDKDLPDKAEMPDLKKVSTDTTAKINVPKPDKNSGSPNKPKKSPKK